MSQDRDFRNCGWAGKTKNLVDAYFCNKKRLQLREADLGIGLCPCKYWIHRVEAKAEREKSASKRLDVSPTLIGEPEKEKKIV
jgi:hypothetical protein